MHALPQSLSLPWECPVPKTGLAGRGRLEDVNGSQAGLASVLAVRSPSRPTVAVLYFCTAKMGCSEFAKRHYNILTRCILNKETKTMKYLSDYTNEKQTVLFDQLGAFLPFQMNNLTQRKKRGSNTFHLALA
ncbi:hypothetical protein [Vibrio harveyi]|uniref:hypothetical protein n=2 Tax=Vibrio harveyi TaxID=669 RepID=UPI003CC81D36